MMVLEWIRRRFPAFDAQARTYLFSSGPVTGVEAGEKSGHAPPSAASTSGTAGAGSLGIGSLRQPGGGR
jgi:hypothetical protein